MKFLIALIAAASSLCAATYYVDSSRPDNSGNGLTWETAKRDLPTQSVPYGVAAGDTVYISGGSSTKTYSFSAYWPPKRGSVGNPVTYKIGQDSGHNGVAIFDYTGSTPQTGWLEDAHNTIFSGDAGDGARHFRITDFGRVLNGTSPNNMRMEYVEHSAGGLYDVFATPGSNQKGLVFYRCYFRVTDPTAQAAFVTSINEDTTNYDQVLVIEECVVEGPRKTTGGFGIDMIKGNSGISVKRSTIRWFIDDTYSGGQHADGWQGLGGAYMIFDGNQFIDCPNYAIFGEATSLLYPNETTPGQSNIRVTNNIFRFTNSSYVGGAPGAIVISVGGPYPDFSNAYFENIVIANNDIIDYLAVGSQPIVLDNKNGTITATFTNCLIQNNIIRSTSGTPISLVGNSTTTVNTNSQLNQAQAEAAFVSYAPYAEGNDFRLADGASSLIGQGVNLSAYFTTDYTGATRTVPWDIGAYKYGGPPVNLTIQTLNVATMRLTQ